DRLQSRNRSRARRRGPASGDWRLRPGTLLRRHAAGSAGCLRRRYHEGGCDFRGTLGVTKDAPVGFAQIRLRFDLDTDAPQDKLDQLLKLTERYCVVYQTIKNGPPVDIKLSRV